jgi:peptidoglycan/LPS O-acetylase OafA/YrhL
MRTIGDAFSSKSSENENNFLILRLLAASLVVYGHAFALAAPCSQCYDIVSKWFGYHYSGEVGLRVFFVVSGFLIFFSFDKRRDLFRFARARVVRIFPGLFVCVLITTLVIGPLFSTLSFRDFFADIQVRKYFFSNVSLYRYLGDLPGVFSANRKASVPNGTLWSLFSEVRLYMIIALLGVFGCVKNRNLANTSIGVLLVIPIVAPGRALLIDNDVSDLSLGVFFAAGSLLYVNRNSIPLEGRALILLILVAVLSYRTPNYELACGAVIAYGVLWIALSRKIKLPLFIRDYSYGIYLYGWPIEQIINHFMPQAGPYTMALIALPAAWLAGAASWFLVEKPGQSALLGRKRTAEVASPTCR